MATQQHWHAKTISKLPNTLPEKAWELYLDIFLNFHDFVNDSDGCHHVHGDHKEAGWRRCFSTPSFPTVDGAKGYLEEELIEVDHTTMTTMSYINTNIGFGYVVQKLKVAPMEGGGSSIELLYIGENLNRDLWSVESVTKFMQTNIDAAAVKMEEMLAKTAI